MHFLLKLAIFQSHVSFQGCNYHIFLQKFSLGQTCVANAVQVAMANGATERADVLLWRWTGQVFSAGQRSAPEALLMMRGCFFQGYPMLSMFIPYTIYTSFRSKMVCLAMMTLVILGE